MQITLAEFITIVKTGRRNVVLSIEYGKWLIAIYCLVSIPARTLAQEMTLSLIPQPANGKNYIQAIGRPDEVYSCSFRNNLYLPYVDANNKYQLAKYENKTLTLIDHPTGGVAYIPKPVVLNDALYMGYITGPLIGPMIQSQLARYDGNTITLIDHPNNGLSAGSELIVYNGAVYMSYLNSNNESQLAKYDGNTISLIPHPAGGVSLRGNPVIFKNRLYFSYQTTGGGTQLAQFDGNSI